jgi:hypothetical protein
MNAEHPGRARLLADVLGEPALVAWRERVRRDCLALLAAAPTGRERLLRDVLEDARHLGFRARLREAGAARARRPRARTRATWAAAAILAVTGAWIAARSAERPGPRDVAPAPVASRPWQVRPRAVAVVDAREVEFAARPGTRLSVVTTRPLAERLHPRGARPRPGRSADGPPSLERLDDAGLLALLPGRPSALVEDGPGVKRLVLLDPADEADLVAASVSATPR